HAYEALECLGGNGYDESFPLARRYREQPVMALWEGSGNVIALDVLRALAREPESAAAFEEEVSLAAGEHPLLDAHIVATRRLLRETAGADAASAALNARRLVEQLALALQGSLLVRTAPTAVSDAFIASRLGETRGHLYGVLPAGADLEAVLSRH
ncbi:MAG TPA: acyl-CoA dehydrogenase family protein, partial [Dermatophilaceae bacterium]